MKKILYDVTPEIVALRERVFVHEQGVTMQDEHSDDETLFVHLCKYQGDKLVAYCRFDSNDGIAHIGRVVVDKSDRGKGLGKEIMLYAQSYAQSINCTQIQLNAQYYAKEFYTKLGYTQQGQIFDDAGIPHIKMTKQLQNNGTIMRTPTK